MSVFLKLLSVKLPTFLHTFTVNNTLASVVLHPWQNGVGNLEMVFCPWTLYSVDRGKALTGLRHVSCAMKTKFRPCLQGVRVTLVPGLPQPRGNQAHEVVPGGRVSLRVNFCLHVNLVSFLTFL